MKPKYPFTIKKIVTAKDFLSIYNKKPGYIKKSKFVMPKLGSSSLGFFEIEIEK